MRLQTTSQKLMQYLFGTLKNNNKYPMLLHKSFINKPTFYFAEEDPNKKKNIKSEQSKVVSVFGKVAQGITYAWTQTFPTQQQQIRKKLQAKKQKARQMPKLTPQELEKIQLQIPQNRRTAMVDVPGTEKVQKKQGVIAAKIKQKFRETEAYKKYESVNKQYKEFKEDLKDYVGSKQGIAFQAVNLAYSKSKEGSVISRAIDLMRETDPEFDIIEFEPEACHIFVTNYQNFLNGKMEQVQKQSNDQAVEFFKAHNNIFKTKKVKPLHTKFWDIGRCFVHDAKIQDKTGVSFVFRIEVQEIYCYLDLTGKIVDGDQSRIIRSTFQFAMRQGGNALEDYGHNWQIVQIQKIEEVKMLV